MFEYAYIYDSPPGEPMPKDESPSKPEYSGEWIVPGDERFGYLR